ncbi:hypothetical protein PTKIN_Ptkin06aG0021000 [Pterospermum kingtungense]
MSLFDTFTYNIISFTPEFVLVKFDICTLAGGQKLVFSLVNGDTSTEDLVPISNERATSNAASIISIGSRPLENKNLEKFTRSRLEACPELYSDAGSDLESGGKAFESKL